MKSIARWRAAAGSRSRAQRGCAAIILMSCVLLLAACGGSNITPRDAAYEPMPQEPSPVDTGGDNVDTTTVDGARCALVIEQHPQEGAQPYAVHIPCTGPTNYQTVPPSSGDHFRCWPEYRIFDVPVPWGNLMHGLEHGAVVIVYNCGGAGQECLDEVARAQAFIATLPPDPTCGTARRVILAPDPTLPVRWGASAWTWTLQADCFDETAFAQFYVDHVGKTYEDLCSGGAPYANLCDGLACM